MRRFFAVGAARKLNSTTADVLNAFTEIVKTAGPATDGHITGSRKILYLANTQNLAIVRRYAAEPLADWFKRRGMEVHFEPIALEGPVDTGLFFLRKLALQTKDAAQEI